MPLHKVAASPVHLYYYNSLSAEKEWSCIPKKVTLESVTECKYDLFYFRLINKNVLEWFLLTI